VDGFEAGITWGGRCKFMDLQNQNFNEKLAGKEAGFWWSIGNLSLNARKKLGGGDHILGMP